MPAKFPIVGHGDPWKPSKKDDPIIKSGDIINAMRRHERRDAFRAELSAFFDTRFGTFAYCTIVALAIFTVAVLALRAAGYSI